MMDVLNEFMYYVNMVLELEHVQILLEVGVNVLIIVIPFFVAQWLCTLHLCFLESY
jgi:hypothetical protein